MIRSFKFILISIGLIISGFFGIILSVIKLIWELFNE